MPTEEFKNRVDKDGHNFIFVLGKSASDLVQSTVAESGYGTAPIKYQFDDSLGDGLRRFYNNILRNPSLFFETTLVISISKTTDRRLVRQWAERLSKFAEKNLIKPKINLLILQPQNQGTRTLETKPRSKYLKQLTMCKQRNNNDQRYSFVNFKYNVDINDNVAQAKNRISARLQIALGA